MKQGPGIVIKPLSENELATIVVDICYEIHKTLGPGCLESVYEEILCYELKQRGLEFVRQKGVPVYWKDIKLKIGFRSDVIVFNKLIVEIKSVEKVAPVHSKILLTYLKLTGIKLGLLVNFGEYLIRDGISRVVHKL